MFGKLMNSFYYGKSGKGDFTQEDLPANRWQLFWQMLRVRLSGLIRLNLMYAVVWLPAIFVIILGVLGFAAGAVTETGEVMENATQIMSGNLVMTLMLLVPCLAITGPFTAGVCYVTRNWARDEHAFVWSDFKDAIKANWKQSLVVSIINAVMPLLCYLGITIYMGLTDQNLLFMIPLMLMVMMFMIWALMISYIYPLIVSYELKLKDVFRNAFLLAVAKLPISIGMRLLHCVPALILVVLTFFNPLWAIMGGFTYYILIGFGLSRFITASVTNGVFDKVINSQIEGVQINRGLRAVDEDEDLDEDDEDEE